MRAVGIRVLKNRLSEYIRLVRSGEVVLVTDRDRVVAELRPPSAGRGERLADAMLAEAVRKGWLRPRLESGVPPSAPVTSWRELEGELAADRGDR